MSCEKCDVIQATQVLLDLGNGYGIVCSKEAALEIGRLKDLLIEARGLTAGLAADLLDTETLQPKDLLAERPRSPNINKVHDFHRRLMQVGIRPMETPK
jgi:hypothetical protein